MAGAKEQQDCLFCNPAAPCSPSILPPSPPASSARTSAPFKVSSSYTLARSEFIFPTSIREIFLLFDVERLEDSYFLNVEYAASLRVLNVVVFAILWN